MLTTVSTHGNIYEKICWYNHNLRCYASESNSPQGKSNQDDTLIYGDRAEYAYSGTILVETLVYENQEEYYNVLQWAYNVGDSNEFVEFMLEMIRNALKEISETHNRINGVTNEEK